MGRVGCGEGVGDPNPGTNVRTLPAALRRRSPTVRSPWISVSAWSRYRPEGAAGRGQHGQGSGPEPAVPLPPQASTERVLRAGKQLYRHLLATCPNLIRDRKYHLRLHR